MKNEENIKGIGIKLIEKIYYLYNLAFYSIFVKPNINKMFNPDKAIKSSLNDVLERRDFVRNLTKSIVNYTDENCLVLSINGIWGSGKSSVINLIKEELDNLFLDKQAQKFKPIVIDFSPWLFSGQNQLVSKFFETLSLKLRKINSAAIKKIGENIENYGQYFEPIITTLIPIPLLSSIASKAPMAVGNALKQYGLKQNEDLETTKDKLEKLLGRLENKIIIFIDDIDRLTKEEIRQIFQLVKSVADFPNVIYVLAFDYSIAVDALQDIHTIKGSDYLEKIIQLQFSLPLPSKIKVNELLLKELDSLISDLSDEKFDRANWEKVYIYSMQYFFKTIRDVNRYINLVKFGYNLAKDELNIVDYFAISALQIFEPKIYMTIGNNKEIFTGSLSSNNFFMDKDLQKSKVKAFCEVLLNNTQNLDVEHVKKLVMELFPKIKHVFEEGTYGGYMFSEWNIASRICSPNFFDKYFGMTVLSHELSNIEFNRIIESSSNLTKFESEISTIGQSIKFKPFLEKFEDNVYKINIEYIENIVSALINLSDVLPNYPTEFFQSFRSKDGYIKRIIYRLLERIPNEQRYKILDLAINRATLSLFTLIELMSHISIEHGRSNSPQEKIAEEKQLLKLDYVIKLEELCSEKIKGWASSQKLYDLHKLAYILYRWEYWGKKEDILKFINDTIPNFIFLFKFLVGFLYTISNQNTDGIEEARRYDLHYKDLKHFIDVSIIEPKLREYYKSSSYKKEIKEVQEAIKLFLNYFDGKINER